MWIINENILHTCKFDTSNCISCICEFFVPNKMMKRISLSRKETLLSTFLTDIFRHSIADASLSFIKSDRWWAIKSCVSYMFSNQIENLMRARVKTEWFERVFDCRDGRNPRRCRGFRARLGVKGQMPKSMSAQNGNKKYFCDAVLQIHVS